MRIRRKTGFALIALLMALLLSEATRSAIAADKGAVSKSHFPKIQTRWITSRGEVVNPGWPVRSLWFWQTPKTEPFFPRVVIRTIIEIPKGQKLTAWSGNVLRVAFLRPNQVLIDTARTLSTVSLRLSADKTPGPEYGLVIEAGRDQAILTDETCSQHGVRIQDVSWSRPEYFLSGRCMMDKGQIRVQLSFPEDLVFLAVSGEGNLMTQKGKGWAEIVFPARAKTGILGRFGLETTGLKEPSSHLIVFEQPATTSPVELHAGTGVTYLRFSQSELGVELSEIALTAKASMSYEIVPKKLDLGMSIFGNLFILGKSAGVASSRFFGFNGRVGYSLPREWLGFKWKASVGWYFWSMHVTDDSYGLSFLSGPQLFLSLGRQLKNRHLLFSYLKFAPAIDHMGELLLGNRELAIGVGYQVSPAAWKRQWSLTADFSHAQYALQHQIGLTTFSLGVQTPL